MVDIFREYFDRCEFFFKVLRIAWKDIEQASDEVKSKYFCAGRENSVLSGSVHCNTSIDIEACAAESIAIATMPVSIGKYWILPLIVFSLQTVDKIDDTDVDAAIIKWSREEGSKISELAAICLIEFYAIRKLKTAVFDLDSELENSRAARVLDSLTRKVKEAEVSSSKNCD